MPSLFEELKVRVADKRAETLKAEATHQKLIDDSEEERVRLEALVIKYEDQLINLPGVVREDDWYTFPGRDRLKIKFYLRKYSTHRYYRDVVGKRNYNKYELKLEAEKRTDNAGYQEWNYSSYQEKELMERLLDLIESSLTMGPQEGCEARYALWNTLDDIQPKNRKLIREETTSDPS